MVVLTVRFNLYLGSLFKCHSWFIHSTDACENLSPIFIYCILLMPCLWHGSPSCVCSLSPVLLLPISPYRKEKQKKGESTGSICLHPETFLKNGISLNYKEGIKFVSINLLFCSSIYVALQLFSPTNVILIFPFES